ncbi:ester cyclase [Chlorella sorokiniana]|uniref:Ester cyclase n=1 Tax=Chlorella sorokiniana TaxID=3076 RepID=A0A2P6TC56_CHLSO|nr:ester cyclase [Chlorella sorokiniana]|eukprot:PRW20221.1 ester cyclase [Chlorella sorokiniana]
MVQLAHDYLIEYLTNKRAELAEQLFDEGVVHKDVVWDASHPTVGVEGMRHYLQDLSTAFPDFWVEIDQYATVDTNSIMVTYRGSATNLGEYHHHKATGHASNFEGANCFRFNHDRSRITHIDVYRSAFAEDLDEVGEKRQAQEGGFRELRLKRLVI